MKILTTMACVLISSISLADVTTSKLERVLTACNGGLSVTDEYLIIELPTKIQYSNDEDHPHWGGDSVNCLTKIMQSTEFDLLITGHADSNGSILANHILAKNRAKGIKSMLINSGVEGSRIFTSSKGELANLEKDASKFVANRRVELELRYP